MQNKKEAALTDMCLLAYEILHMRLYAEMFEISARHEGQATGSFAAFLSA